MGRRKKGFRLPFLNISGGSIFIIIGLLLIAAGLISLASFYSLISPQTGNGRILEIVNQDLLTKFGGLSIFVPFILLLVAGHFFSSKKRKMAKANVTVGLFFIFISLIGLLQSGDWGKYISTNLTLDFSLLGTIAILGVMFIVGLILFFDSSLDAFFRAIFQAFKSTFSFIGHHVYRGGQPKPGKAQEAKKPIEEEDFIMDNAKKEKPKLNNVQPVIAPTHATARAATQPVAAAARDISIKSFSSGTSTTWVYPPLNLLAEINQKQADRGDVARNADIIEKTLDSFGIRAKVAEVNKGPTVTQYALAITMGTKLSKITALGNDLALALAAPTGQVRIEAPIPGRSLVGVEIPNIKPEVVTLKRLLSSPTFTQNPDPLLVPLGLDVSGEPSAASVGKMPHVLIAGTTGSGKSVMLNAWISTFLFRAKPDDLRMILVDPKRVELTGYNGIPHLLTDVIVEPDKILSALRWTVAEMENRYKEFAKVGVRNIEGYNALEGIEKKPYIIFVIDELADLMIFAPGDAEELITRIAQMARATGIHLVLATQRPSVDVITGLMKANIPSRLAFNVSSMIDSRVIIDMPGAEKLLGKGDMLYLPPDQAKPRRIQGPFVSEREVSDLVNFLKSQVPEVHYTEEITNVESVVSNGIPVGGGTAGEGQDPLFTQAVDIISQFDKASASLLQRRLKIGYARAARILDELEGAGYVSAAEGAKPREVIKRQGAMEGQAV